MELRIWRANVAESKVSIGEIPQGWERLGGRGLIARILLDEAPSHPRSARASQ